MKSKHFKQMKNERRQIALERIEILKGMEEKKPAFKERYESLIKRISKKYRLDI